MRCEFRWLTALVCVLFASPSTADTPSPVITLGPNARSLKVGPGMDARGLELKGTKIVGQNLSGAVFDGADLRGAWIEDCHLRGASFRGTDFRGAKMMDCRIQGADFADANVNDIVAAQGEPLKGRHDLHLSADQLKSTASYKRKDLSYCVMDRLRDLDLRGFNLRGSTLTCSEGSRLEGAYIRDARITVLGGQAAQEVRKTQDFVSGIVKCDLRFSGSADLSGIFVYESKLTIPDPDEPATNVTLHDATIYDCRVWFVGSSAKRLLPDTRSFKERRFLLNRLWRDADLSHMNLDQMNLMGCDFGDCDLTSTTFNNAIVDRVTFWDAKGLTEEQIKSTWNYRNGRMSHVGLPEHLSHLKEATSPKE